jgi:hypothetical protein
MPLTSTAKLKLLYIKSCMCTQEKWNTVSNRIFHTLGMSDKSFIFNISLRNVDLSTTRLSIVEWNKRRVDN